MSIGTGTRLGQYEVQDFLGQGAMGVVYRAYHAGLERTGAVKVMQAIMPDADSVARFRHEAQAIAKLRHPNIVDVYDFGEFQGLPYMIVEYVPGGSLAGRMSRRALDPKTALRFLRGMAAGLDYAHSHGIVHRDVKPANVLISNDETPVLADFGLAKLMQGSSLKSMTGVTTGTPAYMAPEQVTGGQVGPAADRYSLATIAYEMLTGVIPFDGEALMELLYAQVHRYPSPPSARYALLGPEVDAVIMRGLAKNPADRWESCTAFVEALAHALAGEPVAPTMVVAPRVSTAGPATGTAVVDRAAPPAAVTARAPATVAMAFPEPAADTTPLSAPDHPKPRRIPRRRLLLGIAAVLIVLLAFGVCSAVAQGTTLSVNPKRVAPGGVVTVTATHVPANKVGEIQLWSVVHTYGFRANANGEVSQDITVPSDIDLGDHTVKICWDDSCHQQTGLRVVAGVAGNPSGPSPSPGTSPRSNASPSPTSSRTSPTPGATPRPSSTPTSAPTSPPKPTPTPPPPPPSPSPTPPPPPPPSPSPNPCPTSAQAAKLTASPTTAVGGTAASLSGANFTPNTTVTLKYYAPQGAASPTRQWTATVACGGTFSSSVTTSVALLPRTDRVVACDTAGRCAQVLINILA